MAADFGFRLSPSSTINLDKTDLTKFNQLVEEEPDVKKCISCGSCTATCTAGKFYDIGLRKAIIYLQRGMEKEAVGMLEHCMLCGKCMMVCPRGLNTRHIILSISRIYKSERQ